MITRFAPSPTGPLHLGHAYSAMLAHDLALNAGGEFLLRIEDIDRIRSRPEWEEAIYEDLAWLGISWEAPVMRQSDRMEVYSEALDGLWARDFLFPCTCTRKDIAAAMSAPQEGAAMGPDGLIYPGTCRRSHTGLPHSLAPRPKDQHLRLYMSLAASSVCEHHVNRSGETLWSVGFAEEGAGPNDEHGWIETDCDTLTKGIGDVVLARRDMGTSYHLAVVLDDAAQGVTHVTRGQDLFEATAIHVVLQRLFSLPTPIYHHHRLIRDETGRRLAKRDDGRSIRRYREDGATPSDIRRLVGLE
ncbi:Glutamate--tRNA ligase [Defluviimonas aquaemixtae]|uniref:Glutamate--tRNA ligase n=1 Tax=Albidovulum aquaemixtae TaxID=1542388 RepID=A0A2R8B619_9RHOB|nr:tRNA glutamyl-Q(34) synthetase GluQRS [Defluviimonas aquaemixtae]SPH17960.1 Glutamate--tRNA ligase [Defluviimonas aquaemixtae]